MYLHIHTDVPTYLYGSVIEQRSIEQLTTLYRAQIKNIEYLLDKTKKYNKFL